MGEGMKKFQEAGSKLKEEVEEKNEKELETKKKVESELAQIRNNDALAKMYNDSASVGSENLGGEIPQLKIHSAGRSQNELADGSEPTNGAFFYKPTATEYKTVDCHVLTISKGFRAPGFGDNETKKVFNQILGGVIIDDGEYKPFLMYFTGLKLSNLWEFGKQIKKYTHAKPVSIPMFAMTVRLTTVQKANEYGKSWVVEFEVVKNEDGSPRLVLDEGLFQFLKDSVQQTEEMIQSVIDAKEVRKDEEVVEANIVDEGEGEQGKDFASGAEENRVSNEDIPF